MKRFLLALSLLISQSVLSLGFGELELKSEQGEPLDARIVLVNLGEVDLTTIKVELASAEAHDAAQIPFEQNLSQLAFRVQSSVEHDAVVRVTSKEPISADFMQFLVDMAWPQGQLQSEYTISLKLPDTAAASSVAVELAQTSSATVIVRKDDTLSQIAMEHKASDVSMTQMMMALHMNNREAFIKDNVNLMRTGAILQLPQAEQVRLISRGEAGRHFTAQMQQWDEIRGLNKTSAQSEIGIAPVVEQSDYLQIATPIEEGAEGQAGVVQSEGEVVDQESQAINLLQEDVAAKQLTNERLEEEVILLKEQVTDMQKLLSVQDEELARMQVNATPDAEKAIEPPANADGSAQPVEKFEISEKVVTDLWDKAREWTSKSLPEKVSQFADVVLLAMLVVIVGVFVRLFSSSPKAETTIAKVDQAPLSSGQGTDDIEIPTEGDLLEIAHLFIEQKQYPEAEKALHAALDSDYDSLQVGHALLRVFFLSNQVDQFIRVAEEMASLQQDLSDREKWKEVVEMGHQLRPDHYLFLVAGHKPEPVDPPRASSADLESLTTDADAVDQSPGSSSDVNTLEIALPEGQSAEQLNQAVSQSDIQSDDVKAADANFDTQTQSAIDSLFNDGQERQVADEFDLKWNLVDTYLDMGDKDGALQLLHELIEDAPEELRDEARRLLKELE
ncbi:MAG: FimV/HubP family polar landmark protein [Sedimenticolaceae bacterium]